MKKKSHEHKTPRDKDGRVIRVTGDHRVVAESVIKTADQGTYDGSISINEMQVFLKGTEYEEFMEWLTGLKDGNTGRFHELDKDGSSTIEAEELSLAVAEYYSMMGKESLEKIVRFAKESLELLVVKAEERRKSQVQLKAKNEQLLVEKKAREEKRKWLANQSLHTTAGMEKLHNIQHKLKAACYSSFSFGMDLEYMFKKFDKDGNGTLDYEELRALVRKVLKVPPTDVSDGELEALFGFLDFDNGGTIEQKELADFLEKKDNDSLALPSHMQYVGPKRTATEELCALINFKTKEELNVERKQPRPPPGEVPWQSSTKCKWNVKPTAGIGLQVYVPKG
ncbi:hypothetical protein TrST_g5863 [Triparma strigata]|uniref:EF-hand domain-containing protein n=2 Tax=Triparma strigata TaxID=1606541 RepID=A0A9W7BBY2_9STRA|nr:hypothetical protein TrST_g5863 [Triparma strigata]